jgi:hypothetical protein
MSKQKHKDKNIVDQVIEIKSNAPTYTLTDNKASRRDLLAGLALAGILSRSNPGNPIVAVELACDYATVMIAKLDKADT